MPIVRAVPGDALAQTAQGVAAIRAFALVYGAAHAQGNQNGVIVPRGENMINRNGWFNRRHKQLEWNAPIGELEVRVNIGLTPAVVINKEYGPWCTDPVRVRLDFKHADWVIEQEVIPRLPNGSDGDAQWVERARFSADTDA